MTQDATCLHVTVPPDSLCLTAISAQMTWPDQTAPVSRQWILTTKNWRGDGRASSADTSLRGYVHFIRSAKSNALCSRAIYRKCVAPPVLSIINMYANPRRCRGLTCG